MAVVIGCIFIIAMIVLGLWLIERTDTNARIGDARVIRDKYGNWHIQERVSIGGVSWLSKWKDAAVYPSDYTEMQEWSEDRMLEYMGEQANLLVEQKIEAAKAARRLQSKYPPGKVVYYRRFR